MWRRVGVVVVVVVVVVVGGCMWGRVYIQRVVRRKDKRDIKQTNIKF